MLFAVEWGGFFSSSASGYSKVLSLLLFKRKSEERPMKVSPWTQYQLVDLESTSCSQLTSGASRRSCGCAPFVSFGRSSLNKEISSLETDDDDIDKSRDFPTPSSASSEKGLSEINCVDDDTFQKEIFHKSCPRITSQKCVPDNDCNPNESLRKEGCNVLTSTERRKVQWTDACGKSLVQIREFEVSDQDLSDDELQGHRQYCTCVIQ